MPRKAVYKSRKEMNTLVSQGTHLLMTIRSKIPPSIWLLILHLPALVLPESTQFDSLGVHSPESMFGIIVQRFWGLISRDTNRM